MAIFGSNSKQVSRAEIEAEEKRKHAEEVRQRWLTIERKRTAREKYEMKEIATWMYIGPLIGLITAVVTGLMIWLSYKNSDVTALWWIAGISILPAILFGIASEIIDGWKASVSAKIDLEIENDKIDGKNKSDSAFLSLSSSESILNGFKYKDEHLYTDNVFEYWFFQVTKFVMTLATIGFAILAAVLLFMWLGSVSIAPTTIIIILLILILFKMK